MQKISIVKQKKNVKDSMKMHLKDCVISMKAETETIILKSFLIVKI